MHPGDGMSILCIRLSGLGDVVHALNALSVLRRHLPRARILWAVEDRFSDLLKGHPHVDDVIVLPRRRWDGWLKNPLRWPRIAAEGGQVRKRLAEERFDVSLDFQSSLKSAWLVRAARARLRVGFAPGISREFSHFYQNALVSVPARGVHRIERNLALLRPLGIDGQYADPVLPRNEAEAQAVSEALSRSPSGGPVVVIHPGTSAFASFKRWPPERYASVADGLAERLDARVVISYGPGERPLAEQVLQGARRRAMLAPEGGLQRLIELLRRADLFVGGDTGPMHVASALGVPVVALFGPKDPAQTGPYCSRSLVVTGNAECRPCNRRRCPHVRCIMSITADQVLEAAVAVLDGGGTVRADKARASAAPLVPAQEERRQ